MIRKIVEHLKKETLKRYEILCYNPVQSDWLKQINEAIYMTVFWQLLVEKQITVFNYWNL